AQRRAEAQTDACADAVAETGEKVAHRVAVAATHAFEERLDVVGGAVAGFFVNGPHAPPPAVISSAATRPIVAPHVRRAMRAAGSNAEIVIMWLVRKRARSVRAQRGESVFLNAAFAAVLIGQGTSPLVNLLERLAASPQAVAARLDGEGDAAPVDCLEQI